MRTLKPKVSTVRVEKTFALVVQHSERKCESSLSSSPNITHHWRYSGRLCYLWFQLSHAKIRTVWP